VCKVTEVMEQMGANCLRMNALEGIQDGSISQQKNFLGALIGKERFSQTAKSTMSYVS
jgi:hypothetical protein